MREVCLGAHPVKHNSEAAHEIEASAASGKRPSYAAARPIFVTANFVTRLLFVTAPNASRAASNMVILRAKTFRGSIPHPMQSLCTLRDHCRQWPRNTRYQADATPYLDRTCTGRIAPALPGALIQSPRRRWRGAAGVGPGHYKPSAATFSKLKAFMRKIAARTLAGLIRALEACAEIFKPAERKNYVAVRGDYLPFPETHHSQWQCPGVSHTHSPP